MFVKFNSKLIMLRIMAILVFAMFLRAPLLASAAVYAIDITPEDNITSIEEAEPIADDTDEHLPHDTHIIFHDDGNAVSDDDQQLDVSFNDPITSENTRLTAAKTDAMIWHRLSQHKIIPKVIFVFLN